MSSGLIFDDIIMNMIRNKVLEQHMVGVDSYFTKVERNILYMYRGSLQDFYQKKGTNGSLDVVCPYLNVERIKTRQYFPTYENVMLRVMILSKRQTISWIPLKSFTNSILLFRHNHTIINLLNRVDILQLDHFQVSLIKKMRQDGISMQPSNCYTAMLFLEN